MEITADDIVGIPNPPEREVATDGFAAVVPTADESGRRCLAL